MKTKLSLVLACLILTITCVLALSSCNKECLHKNTGELIGEVSATCTQDGTIAHYICADCGVILDSNLQVVENIVTEKFGHNPGSSKVESKPTCTEDGKSVVNCTRCNKELSSEKLSATGHSFTESMVIGTNDSLCTNGALIIKTCETCGHVVTDKIAANEDKGVDGRHTVEEWTLLISPTYTETGLMEGKCVNKYCGKTVNYELPCINSEYYTMTTKIPDAPCSGEYNVTFAFNGESYFTYVITNGEDTQTVNKLCFDATFPAHNHVLNGIEMDKESYDQDIKDIVYCPLCPECTIRGTQGYYVCDKCGELIYVLINEKHTASEESWVITLAPGCETEGEKQATCEVEGCETIITEIIPALGHDFIYTLGFANDGKTYVLSGVCKADGCEAVAVHEGVTGVITEEFKATCKSSGLTIHKFVFANSSIDFSTSDISVEFSTEVAQLNHTIDGVKLAENGTYNVANYLFLEKYAPSLVTCSADVVAMVSCSVCERNDIAIILHKDHTSLATPVAGCEDSVEILSCKFCQAEYPVELAGTGHKINKYTVMEKADKDGMYYIGGFCSKCCTKDSTVFEVDPVALTITETKGSCQKPGSINYSLNGNVIFTYETELACHVLKGYDMSNSEDSIYSTTDHPDIKPFGDAIIDSCVIPAEAYFICDVCQEVVRIKAVGPHAATEWTESIPATCDTDGVKVGNCDGCGIELEGSTPAFGHTYEYDFIFSTKTLVGSCITEGCDHTYSLAKTKRVLVESTCVESGYATYTGLNADGKEETIVLDLPLAPHYIEGIKVNEDGAYEITPNKVGALANTNAVCTNAVEGYYVCDGCGQHIQTTVYQPHVSVFEDEAIVVDPTCTENGSKTFCCSLCNEVVMVESIPALGHSISLSIGILPTEGTKGEAIGNCACGFMTSFELPELNADNYDDPKVVKETSCLEDGIYIYSYTITDGENNYDIEFEIVTPKFVYNESCETIQLDIEEDVTFTDPFGNVITVKVVVSYIYFECPGENCDINILHSRSFVYDENLFVYNSNLGEYIISLPEGEK